MWLSVIKRWTLWSGLFYINTTLFWSSVIDNTSSLSATIYSSFSLPFITPPHPPSPPCVLSVTPSCPHNLKLEGLVRGHWWERARLRVCDMVWGQTSVSGKPCSDLPFECSRWPSLAHYVKQTFNDVTCNGRRGRFWHSPRHRRPCSCRVCDRQCFRGLCASAPSVPWVPCVWTPCSAPGGKDPLLLACRLHLCPMWTPLKHSQMPIHTQMLSLPTAPAKHAHYPPPS